MALWDDTCIFIHLPIHNTPSLVDLLVRRHSAHSDSEYTLMNPSPLPSGNTCTTLRKLPLTYFPNPAILS